MHGYKLILARPGKAIRDEVSILRPDSNGCVRVQCSTSRSSYLYSRLEQDSGCRSSNKGGISTFTSDDMSFGGNRAHSVHSYLPGCILAYPIRPVTSERNAYPCEGSLPSRRTSECRDYYKLYYYLTYFISSPFALNTRQGEYLYVKVLPIQTAVRATVSQINCSALNSPISRPLYQSHIPSSSPSLLLSVMSFIASRPSVA